MTINSPGPVTPAAFSHVLYELPGMYPSQPPNVLVLRNRQWC